MTTVKSRFIHNHKMTVRRSAKRCRRLAFLIDHSAIHLIKIAVDHPEVIQALLDGQSGALAQINPQLPAGLPAQDLQVGHIRLPALLLIDRDSRPRIRVRRRSPALTPRQHEVLQDAVNGLTLKQSARRLRLSRSMVSLHRRALKDRLQVESMSAACSRGVLLGLVRPAPGSVELNRGDLSKP